MSISFDIGINANQLEEIAMKKALKNYSLDEINKALYHDQIFNKLWKDQDQQLEQLFIKHSKTVSPKRFHIPPLWIPIVKKLVEELTEIDPYIYVSQIKEKFGKLEVCVGSSQASRLKIVNQSIEGAKTAIGIITLTQLKLFDEFKIIRKINTCQKIKKDIHA